MESIVSRWALSLAKTLTKIDANESRRSVRHVSQRFECGLSRPCMFFRVEDPERVLGSVRGSCSSPIAVHVASHSPQHRHSHILNHGGGFSLVTRFDLDPSYNR